MTLKLTSFHAGNILLTVLNKQYNSALKVSCEKLCLVANSDCFKDFHNKYAHLTSKPSYLEKFALIYYYFFKGNTYTLECPVDIIFSSRMVYFSLA